MRPVVLPAALAASCLLLGACASTGSTAAATSPSTSDGTSAASTSSTSTVGASTSPSTSATPSGSSAPAPSATPLASSVPEGRFAYGDSVMLGSKPLLQKRGFTVDAKVGRQFGASYNAIVKLRDAHRLPRNIVIHLGTNGTIAVRDCKAVVDAAGPERRVFLVNVRVPRPWTHEDNVNIGTCDAAYPDLRVVVINWAAVASKHPEWFGPDNVHPNGQGRTAYTALITTVVTRYAL